MPQASTWPSDFLDTSKPNPSRIYDYLLGGFHNFESDRQLAERFLSIFPDAALNARVNRAFLRRAVTFLAQQGIDQFLDIGSGIPTVGNVHEIVHQFNPAARVVYVDIDPVAVQHSRMLLEDNDNVTAIQGDARDSAAILTHPEARRLLDFDRPVAVLLVSVLQFLPDDADVYRTIQTLRDTIVSGSYIAMSQGTFENAPAELVQQIEQLYAGSTTPAIFRSRGQIEACFAGLDLVEPGLVLLPLWRPETPHDLLLDQPERALLLGGIGRKP